MKPALQQYIESLVGGQFTVTISMVTVTTSATKLVGNNFERMALVMINTGTVNAVILPDISVSTTNGITLNANGGSVTLNAHDDLALVGWNWNGVVNAATTTFTCMEIVRYNAGSGADG